MPKKVAQKQDWIVKGFELFSKDGENGIVVEKIAKSLNCNKSSFYWHFKTKTDFIDKIIEFWKNKETHVILDIVSNAKTPSAQYTRLIKLSFKKTEFIDFPFFAKQYSKSHPDTLLQLEQIEKTRLDFIAFILSDFGLDRAAALRKASILLKYQTGYLDSLRCKEQTANYVSEIKKDLKDLIG